MWFWWYLSVEKVDYVYFQRGDAFWKIGWADKYSDRGWGKCDGGRVPCSMNTFSLNFLSSNDKKGQKWAQAASVGRWAPFRSSQSARTDDKNAFVETLSFLLCRFWLKLKLDIQQIQRLVMWKTHRFSYFSATNMMSNERNLIVSSKQLLVNYWKKKSKLSIIKSQHKNFNFNKNLN